MSGSEKEKLLSEDGTEGSRSSPGPQVYDNDFVYGAVKDNKEFFQSDTYKPPKPELTGKVIIRLVFIHVQVVLLI